MRRLVLPGLAAAGLLWALAGALGGGPSARSETAGPSLRPQSLEVRGRVVPADPEASLGVVVHFPDLPADRLIPLAVGGSFAARVDLPALPQRCWAELVEPGLPRVRTDEVGVREGLVELPPLHRAPEAQPSCPLPERGFRVVAPGPLPSIRAEDCDCK